MNKKLRIIPVIVALLFSLFAITGCSFIDKITEDKDFGKKVEADVTSNKTAKNTSELANLTYDGKNLSIRLNDNKVSDLNKRLDIDETFINLSELDSLGRCGPAEGVVGPETLPTDKRGSIGSVKPSGWPTNGLKNNKYDFVDGKYLYNRCHLIAFSLSGINADERNLITGTRTLNIEGMWEFEEDVLYYIKNTDHHVWYKVTPVFKDDELVARGVQMQAKSLEDDDLEFNVYCFNVEPGVHIDYSNGENYAE